MITVALSTRVGACAEEVWQALTDPEQRKIWDHRILGEVTLSESVDRTRKAGINGAPDDAQPASQTPPNSPPSQQPTTVRWRFLLGGIPQVLEETLIEAEPRKRAVSQLTIGSMRFEQTLTFFSEDDESGPHTRLGMKLVASSHVAVVGGLLGKKDVQRVVMEYIDSTIRHSQKFCER